MKTHFYILLAIFLLGATFRFHNLGNTLSLHRDEAFLGYNAYSILKTGKDMSDKFFPLHLESFIYSPAGYSYFSIPFIAVFGLNEFSVRAASAFFGSLTIIVIYLLGEELFRLNPKFDPSADGRNSKQIKNSNVQNSKNSLEIGNWKLEISVIAAAMLAISPWHINLSRTATENIIVVFFLLLGILFFLKYQEKGYKYLALSFLCFGVTFLLYQAPRAFLPIFVPFLILVFAQKEKIIKDKLVLGFLYLLTIILPVVLILSSSDLSLRIRSLSIFHNEHTKIVLTEQIANDGVAGLPYFATKLFHNKIVAYSSLFLENYLRHFNFDFLFLNNGFPERYKIPFMGLIYIFELPLILLGLLYVFQKYKRVGVFLLGWILITPIGSALTFDDIPNLQRTLISLPAYSLLSASGLVGLLGFIKSRSIKLYKALISITVFVVVYSVGFYLVQYYTQAVNYKTWYRQDGYKDLVYKVNKLLPKYEKVVVTNRESAPTIFFLFFSKYGPSLFQKDTYLSAHRSFDRMNFGKYEFTEEECPLRNIPVKNNIESSGKKGALYVNSGLCKELPQDSRILSEIKRRDNSLVFYILE